MNNLYISNDLLEKLQNQYGDKIPLDSLVTKILKRDIENYEKIESLVNQSKLVKETIEQLSVKTNKLLEYYQELNIDDCDIELKVLDDAKKIIGKHKENMSKGLDL